MIQFPHEASIASIKRSFCISDCSLSACRRECLCARDILRKRCVRVGRSTIERRKESRAIFVMVESFSFLPSLSRPAFAATEKQFLISNLFTQQSTSQRRKEKSSRLAARYLLPPLALARLVGEFSQRFPQHFPTKLTRTDFQSHNDLNYLSHCEFAYHLKKDEICINPYHYTKAEPEFLQPQSPQQQLSILVPKFPTSSPESSTVSSYLDDLSNTVPLNIQYNALK